MHWCYFPSGILENSYLLFNFKEKTDGGPWNKLCGVLGCGLWGKHTSSKFYNSKQNFCDILKKKDDFIFVHSFLGWLECMNKAPDMETVLPGLAWWNLILISMPTIRGIK